MNKKLKRMAIVGATVLMTASSVGFSNAMSVKNINPIQSTGKVYICVNGKELDKDDYNLSTIGTPTVSSQEGHNKLVLSYNEPGWLFVALLTPIIVLAVICLQCLYTKINIKKVTTR